MEKDAQEHIVREGFYRAAGIAGVTDRRERRRIADVLEDLQ
jgi:hypothetical protein